ncbi:hypothetical protein IAT40_001428 [Kwoniella sp. CBS 6097]
MEPSIRPPAPPGLLGPPFLELARIFGSPSLPSKPVSQIDRHHSTISSSVNDNNRRGYESNESFEVSPNSNPELTFPPEEGEIPCQELYREYDLRGDVHSLSAPLSAPRPPSPPSPPPPPPPTSASAFHTPKLVRRDVYRPSRSRDGSPSDFQLTGVFTDATDPTLYHPVPSDSNEAPRAGDQHEHADACNVSEIDQSRVTEHATPPASLRVQPRPTKANDSRGDGQSSLSASTPHILTLPRDSLKTIDRPSSTLSHSTGDTGHSIPSQYRLRPDDAKLEVDIESSSRSPTPVSPILQTPGLNLAHDTEEKRDQLQPMAAHTFGLEGVFSQMVQQMREQLKTETDDGHQAALRDQRRVIESACNEALENMRRLHSDKLAELRQQLSNSYTQRLSDVRTELERIHCLDLRQNNRDHVRKQAKLEEETQACKVAKEAGELKSEKAMNALKDQVRRQLTTIQDLKKKNESLTAQRESTVASRSKTLEELKDKSDTVQTLLTQIEGLKNDNEGLRGTVASVKIREDELDKRCQALQGQIDNDKNNELTNMRLLAQLVESDKKTKALEQSLHAAEIQLEGERGLADKALTSVKTLRKDVEAHKALWQKEKEALQEDRQALHARADEAERQAEEAKKEVQAIKKQMEAKGSTAKKEIQTAEKRCILLQSRAEASELNVEELRNEVKETMKKVDAANAKAERVKKECRESVVLFRTRAEEAEKKVAAAGKEVKEMEEDVQQDWAEMKRMKEMVMKERGFLCDEAEGLKHKLEDAEKQVKTITEKLKAEQTEWKKVKEGLEERLKIMVIKLGVVNHARKALEAKVEDVNRETTTVAAGKQALGAELENLRGDLEAAKVRIAGISSEKAGLQATLAEVRSELTLLSIEGPQTQKKELATVTKQLKTTQDNLLRAQRRIEEVSVDHKAHLERAESVLSQLLEDKKDLKSEIASNTITILELKKELSAARQKQTVACAVPVEKVDRAVSTDVDVLAANEPQYTSDALFATTPEQERLAMKLADYRASVRRIAARDGPNPRKYSKRSLDGEEDGRSPEPLRQRDGRGRKRLAIRVPMGGGSCAGGGESKRIRISETPTDDGSSGGSEEAEEIK